MSSLILLAQVLKIIAGLSQLAFALWLLSAQPRSLLNVSFAAAFGLNGIAYALFNLTPADQRTMSSFGVQGRMIVNWFAAAAMVVFIVALIARMKRSSALALGLAAGLAVLVADVLALRDRNLGFAAFGGIATYPLTAFVLGYLAVAFSSADAGFRRFSVSLSAALAINSVDHLGAEVVLPSPTPAAAVGLQIAAMFAILLIWLARLLLRNPESRRWSSLVVVCFIVPFAFATCVRLATGSYRGFQQSGAVGAGRLAAVAVLAFGGVAATFAPARARAPESDARPAAGIFR